LTNYFRNSGRTSFRAAGEIGQRKTPTSLHQFLRPKLGGPKRSENEDRLGLPVFPHVVDPGGIRTYSLTASSTPIPSSPYFLSVLAHHLCMLMSVVQVLSPPGRLGPLAVLKKVSLARDGPEMLNGQENGQIHYGAWPHCDLGPCSSNNFFRGENLGKSARGRYGAKKALGGTSPIGNGTRSKPLSNGSRRCPGNRF